MNTKLSLTCSCCKERPSVLTYFVAIGTYATVRSPATTTPERIRKQSLAIAEVSACGECIVAQYPATLKLDIKRRALLLLGSILSPLIVVGALYAATSFANANLYQTYRGSGTLMTIAFFLFTLCTIVASAAWLLTAPYQTWQLSRSLRNQLKRNPKFGDIPTRHIKAIFQRLTDVHQLTTLPPPIELRSANSSGGVSYIGQERCTAGAGPTIIDAIPIEWTAVAESSLNSRFPVDAAKRQLRQYLTFRIYAMLTTIAAMIAGVFGWVYFAIHSGRTLSNATGWSIPAVFLLFFLLLGYEKSIQMQADNWSHSAARSVSNLCLTLMLLPLIYFAIAAAWFVFALTR